MVHWYNGTLRLSFPDILKIRYTAADFGRRREFRYSAAEIRIVMESLSDTFTC